MALVNRDRTLDCSARPGRNPSCTEPPKSRLIESECEWKHSERRSLFETFVCASLTTLTLTQEAFSWKPFASERARYTRHSNAPEALIEVPTLLPTMMMRFMAPSPHFSQNASSNTSRFLIRATFYGSSRETDTAKVPRAFVEGLTDAVC